MQKKCAHPIGNNFLFYKLEAEFVLPEAGIGNGEVVLDDAEEEGVTIGTCAEAREGGDAALAGESTSLGLEFGAVVLLAVLTNGAHAVGKCACFACYWEVLLEDIKDVLMLTGKEEHLYEETRSEAVVDAETTTIVNSSYRLWVEVHLVGDKAIETTNGTRSLGTTVEGRSVSEQFVAKKERYGLSILV